MCFPSSTPLCLRPSLFYLRCRFYFLSTLYLFPSLIIAPPSTLSNSFFLSYIGLNLFTPVLTLAHWLFLVCLWVGLLLGVFVFFLGCLILFWENLYNSIKDVEGTVTISQPARGKDSPKNHPTTTKTRLPLKADT